MLPTWFIKLAFHLLYYQLAWTYDGVAWLVSFGQWAAWRRLALPFLQPGGPTLELAYGTGGFFIDLLKAGHQPIGLDLSPYMACLASRRLRQVTDLTGFGNLLGLNILNVGQAQALPFPPGHFANVVATFPTEYIFDPATLAEIRRVLQPNGHLVIVLEGELRGPWPIRQVIDWLYQITGQRGVPAPQIISPLQNYFTAHWQRAEQDGGAAYLLVGVNKLEC